MVKIIELIIIFILIVFSFFAGVKYSDEVKQRSGWLFENREEVDLPVLKNTEEYIDSPKEIYNNDINFEEEKDSPAEEFISPESELEKLDRKELMSNYEN